MSVIQIAEKMLLHGYGEKKETGSSCLHSRCTEIHIVWQPDSMLYPYHGKAGSGVKNIPGYVSWQSLVSLVNEFKAVGLEKTGGRTV